MAQEIGAAGPLPPSARNAFDVPEDVVYLNCASLAPRLKRVTAAGHAAVDRMAAPWNIHAPDWFRDARALAGAFARLIAAPAECAALVPSVSYGIAAAARGCARRAMGIRGRRTLTTRRSHGRAELAVRPAA
jgi:kynureninase